ncbi:MAG: bifunctional folylpolyglutamate synthase/dihydrofolate synthase [Mediterranea sp.]|jgi:dihydrofolate synthase/folylpolyglutamate synthase|nr:bifunctional folylpolyglutamate synthase/dihydrofolate synthase [Mediterranea sp.]
MNYQETIAYLFESAPMFQQIGGEAYKPGLATTEKLDEHFGHPHRQFKTIHVGGTNGKGSCAHSIAAVLQVAGYKVGLYTSPHLLDFRERIRVGGEMVPEQYVVDFVERNRAFFEPLRPSFFELTTAMAFRYFADQQIDVAVVEVGMGGRLDCTNIISPDLCVITNIGMDHTQYLGHTLEKIAREKAGIIKRGTPVVIGRAEGEVRRVFEEKAKEMEAPIVFAERFKRAVIYGEFWIESLPSIKEKLRKEVEEDQVLTQDKYDFVDYNRNNEHVIDLRDLSWIEELFPYLDLSVDDIEAVCEKLMKTNDTVWLGIDYVATQLFFFELQGYYQAENILTILTAIRELRSLGYGISRRDVLIGLANVTELTGFMGRYQILATRPLLVCDTGHNVDGMRWHKALFDQYTEDSNTELHIVLGVVDDKDVRGMLELLPKNKFGKRNRNVHYYFTQANVKRAMPAERLRLLADSSRLKGTAYPTVIEAVQAALKDCPPDEDNMIFVGGSTFVVADLLANRDALDLHQRTLG